MIMRVEAICMQGDSRFARRTGPDVWQGFTRISTPPRDAQDGTSQVNLATARHGTDVASKARSYGPYQTEAPSRSSKISDLRFTSERDTTSPFATAATRPT